MRLLILTLLFALLVAPFSPRPAWCSTELVILYTADNDGFIDPCG